MAVKNTPGQLSLKNLFFHCLWGYTTGVLHLSPGPPAQEGHEPDRTDSEKHHEKSKGCHLSCDKRQRVEVHPGEEQAGSRETLQ